MNRKWFLLLILLIQISWNWSGMSDGEAALANFTKKFNQEISKEYGYFLFGSGASFPVKIEDIILSYQAKNSLNVIGARKLAVEISHKMINRMNEDKNLLKYLSSNPASVKHVNLTIAFNEETPGLLHSVMVIGSRNKVVYNTNNEDRSMLVDLYEETFDEAEKIVRQEGPVSNIIDQPSKNSCNSDG